MQPFAAFTSETYPELMGLFLTAATMLSRERFARFSIDKKHGEYCYSLSGVNNRRYQERNDK